jgi:hypothetical protein
VDDFSGDTTVSNILAISLCFLCFCQSFSPEKSGMSSAVIRRDGMGHPKFPKIPMVHLAINHHLGTIWLRGLWMCGWFTIGTTEEFHMAKALVHFVWIIL